MGPSVLGSGSGWVLGPIPTTGWFQLWERKKQAGKELVSAVLCLIVFWFKLSVSCSLTECSVHSHQKIQTNCSTFRQFLTNELFRNWWKGEYAPFTMIPRGGRESQDNFCAPQRFHSLSRMGLEGGSWTRRASVSLYRLKGFVLDGRSMHT